MVGGTGGNRPNDASHAPQQPPARVTERVAANDPAISGGTQLELARLLDAFIRLRQDVMQIEYASESELATMAVQLDRCSHSKATRAKDLKVSPHLRPGCCPSVKTCNHDDNRCSVSEYTNTSQSLELLLGRCHFVIQIANPSFHSTHPPQHSLQEGHCNVAQVVVLLNPQTTGTDYPPRRVDKSQWPMTTAMVAAAKPFQKAVMPRDQAKSLTHTSSTHSRR